MAMFYQREIISEKKTQFKKMKFLESKSIVTEKKSKLVEFKGRSELTDGKITFNKDYVIQTDTKENSQTFKILTYRSKKINKLQKVQIQK